MNMSNWKLTVTDNNDRENCNPEDLVETFVYKEKDYAIKQALYILADDNGLFETEKDLQKVRKKLEKGCYIDEDTDVTYKIEETEEEGDEVDLEREDYWEDFDLMSLVDGYGEDEDFEDEDDDWDEDDEDDDWDEEDDFDEDDFDEDDDDDDEDDEDDE
jgi:hypothetical protein